MSFSRTIYFALLLAATGVIGVRRFALNQVPSQVPAAVVHLSLLVSCAVLGRQIWRWSRTNVPKKPLNPPGR